MSSVMDSIWGPLGPGDIAESPIQTAVRREYSRISLVELSRRLWGAHDIHEAVEALLMSLMGQVGTAQVALWLHAEGGGGQPVLMRCHGMDRAGASALGAAHWQGALGHP